ncbi:DUF6221 family protein [uncultured Arthrobacter sp.]|uniref:DUF6221 family protein n=1 Tax=uncultured Arthrobacter sp. TaxID=114050 RepID=UPI0025EDBF63|nr:DUF6221 family protein [uncultured Arthrobacter sp.]
MTTQTLSLTDFLLARVAEDEAVAREAGGLAETPWRATYGRQVETARDGYLVTPEDEHSYSDDPTDAVSEHIARHDPARVLAECEAKRRIVERETERLREQWRRRVDEHRQTFDEWMQPPYGETLRDLASVYADHPDYRQEWKP